MRDRRAAVSVFKHTKTNIDIDGFILFYGCVKETSYMWPNLAKMCRLLLPRNEMQRIKYFTAIVPPRSSDPEKSPRQRLYLCALQTIANLEIIFSSFLSDGVSMPFTPPGRGFYTVEKSSNVNSVTHLLLEGFIDGESTINIL